MVNFARGSVSSLSAFLIYLLELWLGMFKIYLSINIFNMFLFLHKCCCAACVIVYIIVLYILLFMSWLCMWNVQPLLSEKYFTQFRISFSVVIISLKDKLRAWPLWYSMNRTTKWSFYDWYFSWNRLPYLKMCTSV